MGDVEQRPQNLNNQQRTAKNRGGPPAAACGGWCHRGEKRWAASDDVWWRRTAVVCTVALNTKSRGGTGDVPRTLDVCDRLAADAEDMVVKGVSWALRSLVSHDPAAVRAFLAEHDDVLAARVRREVRTKLDTGKKS